MLLRYLAVTAAASGVRSHVIRPAPGTGQAAALPQYRSDELYSMVTGFLDAFMYPNNEVQARMINSTIFSEDIIGRVDVTRTFIGRELNTEYIFGLFAQVALSPQSFTLLSTPLNYRITQFSGTQNIAATTAIVNFSRSSGAEVSPVEVGFWTTWDADRRISQYDATFRWLDWNFDDAIVRAGVEFQLSDRAQAQAKLAGLIADSLCETAAKSCTGDDQQYESVEACHRFMASIPFGRAYQLGFNTLLCRMVHQPMVPLRPQVHCPHIGPSGGSMCVDDRTYAGTVTGNPFKIQSFVPCALSGGEPGQAADGAMVSTVMG